MPESRIVDTSLGSRHRAAIGITEETDAVVVVVSEERGTISFCFSGNIVSNLDGASLRQALLGLFGRKARKKGSKKVVSTPAGRPSYASVPGFGPRPSTITTPVPTPSPVAPVGTQHISSIPPPLGPAAAAAVRIPAPPRPSSIPPEPEPSESTEGPESGNTEASTELPESPAPKGRGTTSPEEVNE
jgi:hypothetical protein